MNLPRPIRHRALLLLFFVLFLFPTSTLGCTDSWKRQEQFTPGPLPICRYPEAILRPKTPTEDADLHRGPQEETPAAPQVAGESASKMNETSSSASLSAFFQRAFWTTSPTSTPPQMTAKGGQTKGHQKKINTKKTQTSSAGEPEFGCVHLNEGSAEELQRLPGIGPGKAQKIIKRRPFRRLRSLKRVKGIGPKTWKKLRDKLCPL